MHCERLALGYTKQISHSTIRELSSLEPQPPILPMRPSLLSRLLPQPSHPFHRQKETLLAHAGSSGVRLPSGAGQPGWGGSTFPQPLQAGCPCELASFLRPRREDGGRDVSPHVLGFDFVRKDQGSFSALELNLPCFDWPDFVVCPSRAKQ